MLAYDYPLLNVFWSMLMIFLFVAWIILLLRVFSDIFRRRSSGWSKALWSIFVIVAPLLGVLVYLIVNGGDMMEREVDDARAQRDAVDDYIRRTASAPGASTADELTKLAALRDQGVLDDAEFAAQKARLLA